MGKELLSVEKKTAQRDEKIAALRKMLNEYFKKRTAYNEKFVRDGLESNVMSPELKNDFAGLWNAVNHLFLENLHEKNKMIVTPDNTFFEILERVMRFSHCHNYEVFIPREDITDEEILAHEAAIRAHRTSEMEDLRTPEHFRTLLLTNDDYWSCLALYRNLEHVLLMYAHQAKELGAHEGARAYLRATSLLKKCTPNAPQFLHFRPDQIDQIISDFQLGQNELLLERDYVALADWNTYRKKQLKLLAAAKHQREAGKAK